MKTTKRSMFGALMLAGVAVSVAPAFAQAGAPGEVCATSEFSWNGDRRFLPWDAVARTGVIIPAPAAGETLRVLTATYATYDRYPDSANPSRAGAGQLHESVGLMIGGVQVGSLSADVPNSVAEGAPTDWYSGIVTGSFGGGGTVITGGELVVRHASLYGFNESPNSVYASQVTVTIERCTTPPTTTAPATTAPATTAPATTAPATTAPATTAPATTAPATTIAPTTTISASGGPTTTISASGGPTTTISGGATPTTQPFGTLPATGGDMTFPLILASLAAGTGTILVLVRRKAGAN